MAEARWICVGCGEPWDLDDVPPDEAECMLAPQQNPDPHSP